MSSTTTITASETAEQKRVNIPVEVKSNKVLLYNFRFRRVFYEEDIRSMVAREELADLVAYGLPEEALGKGWLPVKKGTEEPLKQADDFEELLKPLLARFVLGAGNERAYGHCLFAIIGDEDNNPHLRVFEPEDYKIQTDDFGKILSAEAKETVIGSDKPNKYIWETKEELQNIHHVVVRPGKKVNQGKSYLEAIWDSLISINLLKEHTCIFVIRNGAGRLILYVPDAMYQNTTFMSSMEDALIKQNSANSVLIVPMGNDKEFKPVMDLATSNQPFNVLEYRDLYLESISIKTGLPASRMIGHVPGEMMGGEKNELQYFDVLEKIQKEYHDAALWLTDRLNETFFKSKMSDFDIMYNVREELTEEGRLLQKMSKFNLLIRILERADLLQIDLKEAKAVVELDYKETLVEVKEEIEEETDDSGINPTLNKDDKKEPPTDADE